MGGNLAQAPCRAPLRGLASAANAAPHRGARDDPRPRQKAGRGAGAVAVLILLASGPGWADDAAALADVPAAIETQPLPDWLDRLRGSIDLNQDGEIALDLETIQPVLRLEAPSLTAFLQGRVAHRSVGTAEGDWLATIGGGVRVDVLDVAMIGLNAFYDRTLDERHERLSVGAELFTGPLTLRANVYEAISPARQIAATPTVVTYEQALDGVDASVTGPVPYLPWLTVSAGHYWWDGIVNDDLYGLSTGLGAQVTDRIAFRIDGRTDRQGTAVFGRLTVTLGVPETVTATAWDRPIDDVAFRADTWRTADLAFVERSRTMTVDRWQVAQGAAANAAGGPSVTGLTIRRGT